MILVWLQSIVTYCLSKIKQVEGLLLTNMINLLLLIALIALTVAKSVNTVDVSICYS